ncbi:MAG: hypothetical protein LCH73_06340 [Proteobacteria bacterium]|nr:hypothetical protein [Pseudomonadota bacterium]
MTDPTERAWRAAVPPARQAARAGLALMAFGTLLALAACRPDPPPPAPPAAPAPSQPAPPPPAPSAASAAAPLPDQPPVQAYTAYGESPAWQASVDAQRTLTLTLADGSPRTVAVTPLAYARSVEFGAEDAGGRVVLSITSERPCRAADGQHPAYAATLIVGREVRKGCAAPA